MNDQIKQIAENIREIREISEYQPRQWLTNLAFPEKNICCTKKAETDMAWL